MLSLFVPIPLTKISQECRSLLIQLGGYESKQLGELLYSQSGREHLERVTARKERQALAAHRTSSPCQRRNGSRAKQDDIGANKEKNDSTKIQTQ